MLVFFGVILAGVGLVLMAGVPKFHSLFVVSVVIMAVVFGIASLGMTWEPHYTAGKPSNRRPGEKDE